MSSSTKHIASDAIKIAYDKGQNWISNRVEKIACEAIKFKILKNGYNRIRPRVFPKGLATFRNENVRKFQDEDDFSQFARQRVHSVDVSMNHIHFSYLNGKYMSEDFDYDFGEFKDNLTSGNNKEALLFAPNIELEVIDAITTPKRYGKVARCKQDKVIVKSISKKDDIKILPSVLLTYDSKFTRINDNSRRLSLQSYSESSSSSSFDLTSSSDA